MPRLWRTRGRDPRPAFTRRGGTLARTEMADAFRRIVQTVIVPGFQFVADSASHEGLVCSVECELEGVHPRATFTVRPSGRSIRFQLDAAGNSVWEIEGVYHRPLGQRMCWTTVDDLQRQLTGWYAQSAAAAVVRDHFRTVGSTGA